MNFLQTTSDLVAAEVSQSSFWYQVEAIIGAIILLFGIILLSTLF